MKPLTRILLGLLALAVLALLTAYPAMRVAAGNLLMGATALVCVLLVGEHAIATRRERNTAFQRSSNPH